MAGEDYDEFQELNGAGDGIKSTINEADDEEFVIKTTDHMSCLEQALLGYNDPQAEEAVAEFKRYNIRFKDLAALDDEDLEVLGIKNADTRRQMLTDFANFPNQEKGFDKLIAKTNPKEYNEMVMKNIAVHLENLHTALLIARVKLDVIPPEDIYLDDEQIYASDLVVKVIERMTGECDRMEDLLSNIYSTCTVDNRKPSLLVRTAKACLYSGLAVAGGFLAVKYLRPQRLWTKWWP